VYTRKDGRVIGQYEINGKTRYIYGRDEKPVTDRVAEAITSGLRPKWRRTSLLCVELLAEYRQRFAQALLGGFQAASAPTAVLPSRAALTRKGSLFSFKSQRRRPSGVCTWPDPRS